MSLCVDKWGEILGVLRANAGKAGTATLHGYKWHGKAGAGGQIARLNFIESELRRWLRESTLHEDLERQWAEIEEEFDAPLSAPEGPQDHYKVVWDFTRGESTEPALDPGDPELRDPTDDVAEDDPDAEPPLSNEQIEEALWRWLTAACWRYTPDGKRLGFQIKVYEPDTTSTRGQLGSKTFAFTKPEDPAAAARRRAQVPAHLRSPAALPTHPHPGLSMPIDDRHTPRRVEEALRAAEAAEEGDEGESPQGNALSGPAPGYQPVPLAGPNGEPFAVGPWNAVMGAMGQDALRDIVAANKEVASFAVGLLQKTQTAAEYREEAFRNQSDWFQDLVKDQQKQIKALREELEESLREQRESLVEERQVAAKREMQERMFRDLLKTASGLGKAYLLKKKAEEMVRRRKGGQQGPPGQQGQPGPQQAPTMQDIEAAMAEEHASEFPPPDDDELEAAEEAAQDDDGVSPLPDPLLLWLMGRPDVVALLMSPILQEFLKEPANVEVLPKLALMSKGADAAFFLSNINNMTLEEIQQGLDEEAEE